MNVVQSEKHTGLLLVTANEQSTTPPWGRHTRLLLVTAIEQSTTPGDTRESLTMGTLGTSHWTVISHC